MHRTQSDTKYMPISRMYKTQCGARNIECIPQKTEQKLNKN